MGAGAHSGYLLATLPIPSVESYHLRPSRRRSCFAKKTGSGFRFSLVIQFYKPIVSGLTSYDACFPYIFARLVLRYCFCCINTRYVYHNELNKHGN